MGDGGNRGNYGFCAKVVLVKICERSTFFPVFCEMGGRERVWVEWLDGRERSFIVRR